jgi:hypothetical protein
MGLLDWLFCRRARGPEETISPPFPDAWLEILAGNVPQYARLPAEQRKRLQEMMQAFVAEKEFLGCGELSIDEEIKVTIAGQACILLLGLPELGVYPRLREIIVYPQDFGQIVEAVGPDGRRYRIPEMYAGQAWRRGPVVLAWDQVQHSVASPCDGYNVVFHEFAHVLDMMSKSGPHGVQSLLPKEQYVAWSQVFKDEYQAFVEPARRGIPTFLDPYAASNPAEFFAVVTEHFFEQPRQLKAHHPELYQQWRTLYRQDPASWRHPRTGHWA